MSATFASASSQSLSMVDASSLKPTGNFTIMAWILTSTTGVLQTVFQTYAQNTNRAGIYLDITTGNKIELLSGKNTGTTSGTDYQVVASSASVTSGTWVHVAGRYDGTNIQTVVNGAQDGTIAWGNAPAYQATNYPRVGARNNTGSNMNFFNGTIAELRFWNGSALTDQQIMTEMRSMQPQILTSNLVLWLPLDNSTLPATYTDFSQNGNTATPVNTPTVDQAPPF
jgi:hypothetical protein